MTNGVEYFSCGSLSFIYLSWDVCSILLPILEIAAFFLLLIYGSYFYILDISPLSDVLQIIYQCLIDLFIFFTKSFIEQKVLLLIKSNLLFFNGVCMCVCVCLV